MTRTFIGRDGSGVGCIKIMEGNYDPYTALDSEFYKHRYNTKLDAVRFHGQNKLNYFSVGSDGDTEFLPAGTNKNSFTRVRNNFGADHTEFGWKKTYWDTLGSLDYNLPLFDVKIFDNSGWFVYNRVKADTGNLSTKYYTRPYVNAGWMLNMSYNSGGYLEGIANIPSILGGYGLPGENQLAMVWNLPGDETDILFPPQAPVPGQKVVQITKDFCRVSKPGYDVSDIAAKLAFDSSARPAKIIASGDIALPSGVVTTFDFSDKLTGISLGGDLVADVIQYKGSTITFPATLPTDDDDYGAPYRIVGTTIQFNNTGSACRARFIIVAQDNSAATSGSNKVLRQVEINGENVVQFLRPGAADPPSLADVIIDSRWPCLQILKTGVFNIPTGSAEATDITFDSGGLFPFIKYMTIHGGGQPRNVFFPSNSGLDSASKRIRMPYVVAGFARNPDSGAISRYVGGDTTMCQLTTNRARFITYRGLSYDRIWDDGFEDQSVLCPATKIRYYIFGIPA